MGQLICNMFCEESVNADLPVPNIFFLCELITSVEVYNGSFSEDDTGKFVLTLNFI